MQVAQKFTMSDSERFAFSRRLNRRSRGRDAVVGGSRKPQDKGVDPVLWAELRERRAGIITEGRGS